MIECFFDIQTSYLWSRICQRLEKKESRHFIHQIFCCYLSNNFCDVCKIVQHTLIIGYQRTLITPYFTTLNNNQTEINNWYFFLFIYSKLIMNSNIQILSCFMMILCVQTNIHFVK